MRPTSNHRRAAMLAAVLALIAWMAPASADRLNGELQQDPEGRFDTDVRWFVLSPDGDTVVYAAQEHSYESFDLFAVPTRGGDSRRLSVGLPPGSHVFEAAFTADGSTVVYRAQGPERVIELFAVRLNGATPTKLSPDLGCCRDVGDFTISPGGSRVVYRVADSANGGSELRSAAIDGSSDVRLSPAGTSDTSTWPYRVTSDGTRAVFVMSTGAVSSVLYSAPIAGGAVEQHSPASTSGIVPAFRLSPDGERVVFTTEDESGLLLWSDAFTGGDAVRLGIDPPFVSHTTEFTISPDSATVAYVSNQDSDPDAVGASGPASHDDDGLVDELFVTSITGGPSVKLSTAGSEVDALGFFTPDSSHITFYEYPQLYSVPTTGGEVVRLNGDLVTDGRVMGHVVTRDSSRVVYRAYQDSATSAELFSVRTTGGEAIKINTPISEISSVSEFVVTPDSSRVIYRADEQFNVHELFATSVVGRGSIRIGPDMVRGGDIKTDLAVTPDSRRVVFLADANVNGWTELFSEFAGARCKGTFATIIGTDGPDILRGTDGPDVIVGLGGADLIQGKRGADLICGGPGDDDIRGGKAGDTIHGQRGADTIRGQSGRDTIRGDSGADWIDGGGAGDQIRGGPGNDTVFGGSGPDEVAGNGGDDDLDGGTGTDRVSGGSGRDVVDGNRGDDLCFGGSGLDRLLRCEGGD